MTGTRDASWPYLAAELKRTFDPALIERQGREILLRSINNGRLLAFVGSGVSIEVGRPSWRQMAAQIVDAAKAVRPGDMQFREEMAALKHVLDVTYGERDDNPLVYLQVCDELLKLHRTAPVEGQSQPSVGTLIQEQLSDGASPGPNRSLEKERTLEESADECSLLPGALDLKAAFKTWIKSKGASRHQTTMHHLAARLGVRRFATTNYDAQIESELQRMGWEPRPAPGREGNLPKNTLTVGAWQQSATLTPLNLGYAFTFAAEGRRRHASVLHLHGNQSDPSSIVATEAEYQRHYLRGSPRRDLLDSAVSLIFGCNPILYVGIGLSEDDVLRPLRQILSSAGEQDDALSVALMPAADCTERLDRAAIERFVRYGIHTVYYDLPGAPRGKPWLLELRAATAAVRAALSRKAGRIPKSTASIPKAPDAADADSIVIGNALKLIAALDRVARCSSRLSTESRDAALRLLDAAEASITSCCLHLSLQAIDEQREGWAKDLTDPFSALERRVGHTMATVKNPYRHVGVMTAQGKGTAKEALFRLSGSRWSELFSNLAAHEPFVRRGSGERDHGRRVVLIPTPRGSGKGSMFDELSDELDLRTRLCEVLSGPGSAEHYRFALFSMMFLVDVTDVIQAVDQLVGLISPKVGKEAPLKDDPFRRSVLGQIERSLTRLTASARESRLGGRRLMLVISNAGGLFHRDGESKNGQVARALAVLMSSRFVRAPIDLVVFCDDQHVPRRFRDLKRHSSRGSVASSNLLSLLPDQAEAQSRLAMLGIRPLNLKSRNVHVFVPGRSKARDVAWEFKTLRPLVEPDEKLGKKADSALKRIYLGLGRSRIGITLVLAQAAEKIRLDECDARFARVRPLPLGEAFDRYADRVSSRMATQIHEAFPDAALQYVLDEWAAMHRQLIPRLGIEGIRWTAGLETALPSAGAVVVEKPVECWDLMIELLWHLSIISHPVEMSVLVGCPGVQCLLRKLGVEETSACVEVVKFALEVCVERRLAFRIRPRVGWGFAGKAKDSEEHPNESVRYTVHRAVQRHFVRTMGGRNVESSEWDQFTTSLYASQRDELPSMSTEAHHRVMCLVESLIGYGRNAQRAPTSRRASDMWLEAAKLRAAYFVARSTYSLGVLSHIARLVDDDERLESGLMEEYRRRVRWITHRARSLELRADGRKTLQRAARPFLAGEVVWLYAECGAVSLAQGKLEDADGLLQLALRSVRRIETDEQGSLHVRILLHLAMTHVERGRPGEARRLLEPIANRADGHPVPPLLAEWHLGLIDHLAGDYGRALEHYTTARTGLARLGRNRAEALVMKHLADLTFAMSAVDREGAVALARDSMSIAQRGGHEDVRMLAILTYVRLRHGMRRASEADDTFSQLDLAQQYARRMGIPRIECTARELRARLLLEQGETQMSMREAVASIRLAAFYDLKLMKSKAMLTLAEIAWRRKERGLALHLVREGGALANATEYFSCVRGFRRLEVAISSGNRDS